MSRVVVLGASPRVDGWALAGALVMPARDEVEVRRAWELLPGDAGVVILTAAAAEALGDVTRGHLVVVLP
jgi:hypothetical protein